MKDMIMKKKNTGMIMMIIGIIATVILIIWWFTRTTTINHSDIDFLYNFNNLEEAYYSEERDDLIIDKIDKELEIIENAIANNHAGMAFGMRGNYSNLSEAETVIVNELKYDFLAIEDRDEKELERIYKSLKDIIHSLIKKVGLNNFKLENDVSLATLNLKLIYNKEFALSSYLTWKNKEEYITIPFSYLTEIAMRLELLDSGVIREYLNALLAIEDGDSVIILNGTQETLDETFFKYLLFTSEILEDNGQVYRHFIDVIIQEY